MILCFDQIFFELYKEDLQLSFFSHQNEVKQEDFSKAKGIVVRLGESFNEEFVQKCPNLNFFATITTGLDRVPVEYCKKNNIDLISLKGEVDFLESVIATPEHTWAILMSLMRKIPWSFDHVKAMNWDRTQFYGNELKGKTLGILGLGRVGRHLAKFAEAFNMKILFHDNNEVKHDTRAEKVPLKELFNSSDIVCICIELSKENTRFVNNELISLMKPTSLLINTSRGQVIDESSLYLALESKRIAGAAVDVLANESNLTKDDSSSKLINYSKSNSNLLITPHIAGSTHESMSSTATFILNKIRERGHL